MEEVRRAQEEYEGMMEELRQGRIEANQVNNGLQERVNQLLIQVDDLKVQVQQKNNLIADLKEKNALIDEFAGLCQEQQAKLEAQDKKIKELSGYKGEDVKQKQKQKANRNKQLQEQVNRLRADLLKE